MQTGSLSFRVSLFISKGLPERDVAPGVDKQFQIKCKATTAERRYILRAIS